MTGQDEAPTPGGKSETVSAAKDAAIALVAKTLAAAAHDVFVHLAMQAGQREMGTELKSFLGGANSPQMPPEALDASYQALIDDLEGASDADFDGGYVAQQQSVHGATITLFETYRKSGSGGLANLCGLTLPVLEHHREMADDLAAKLKR